MCGKISANLWDRCGIWGKKVKHKQIVGNSLCGKNVGFNSCVDHFVFGNENQ